MKNFSIVLSILAFLAAVVGLAFALASFFRNRGFCCCEDDDLDDYYFDEDDDCCCDEGPIRIDDIQPQAGEDTPAAGDDQEIPF